MSTSTSDNNIYPKFCEHAATDENVFKTFRTSSEYNVILEHVTEHEGLHYYHQITANKKILSILEKFKVNDIHGSPNISNYEFGSYSPTTLRYAKVLSDLSQINLEGIDIVEIGAGYGGQYTVLRQYATPKSYTFIDLPEVLKLQKKYIESNNLDDIELNFYSYTSLPKISADLVISNYALSECIKSIQDLYIEKVINNCKKGYITHNNFEGYTHEEFKTKVFHDVKQHAEIPCTGPNNVLLTWN